MKETGLTFIKLILQVNFDWDDTLKISEENIDYSTEAFLNKITVYLIAILPLKKLPNTN